MAARCVLYYITDRSQLPGGETARRRALLDKIGEAARAGVDYVQLREKDLSTRELEALAREAVRIVGDARRESQRGSATRLLINSRTDVALAAGTDGVHLRSDDVSASTVRSIWKAAVARDAWAAEREPVVAVACHSLDDVRRAEREGADFCVFAPVFEKRPTPQARPQGLAALREVCGEGIPVLALGGVAVENAASCLAAGAAGVAGIRLFQENKIHEVARALRAV